MLGWIRASCSARGGLVHRQALIFGPAPPPRRQHPSFRDGRSSSAASGYTATICVAHMPRRVSSKLWKGWTGDEHLGFWATFVPNAFWSSAARKPSIRKPGTSYGNGPLQLQLQGEPNVSPVHLHAPVVFSEFCLLDSSRVGSV